jgi:hypothetical protein
MAAIASTLRYACIDTPLDFGKFIIGEFSPANTKESKNFSSSIGLIEKVISYVSCRGFSTPGIDHIGDQCKAYKILTRGFNFICSTPEEALNIVVTNPKDNAFNSKEVAAAKNVINFVTSFFENGAALLKLISKFELPIDKEMIGVVAGISDVAAGVGATFGMAEDVYKIAQEACKPSLKDRTLTILSRSYSLLKNITYVALSALSFIATFTSVAVAAPVWLFPTLLLTAAGLGIFSKYVKNHITPAYKAPVQVAVA